MGVAQQMRVFKPASSCTSLFRVFATPDTIFQLTETGHLQPLHRSNARTPFWAMSTHLAPCSTGAPGMKGALLRQGNADG